MGRRTSGAQVGVEKIGLVQARANTLSTLQPNQDLTITPNGTGITQISRAAMVMGNGTTGGEIRLGDADSSNWTVLRTAASTTTNRTLTFPDSNGSPNFVLQTDGSGNLSWVAQTTAGVTSADAGASATVHYPFFGTNAGSIPTGQVTAISVRSNLAFIPSTGELFSDVARHPNIVGSNNPSGTVTIRGTSSGTKATASVLLTDNVSSSTTGTGTLVVSGGVGVSGQVTCTTLVETSSIAFKENVTPLDNALDVITQLFGVTYDRKDNKEHEAGLIAEQVYQIAPDLVSLDKDGKPYGIKYTKLGAYLVESIKSLKIQIDELKGK